MFLQKLYHNCDVYTNEAQYSKLHLCKHHSCDVYTPEAQNTKMLNANRVSEFGGLAKLVE